MRRKAAAGKSSGASVSLLSLTKTRLDHFSGKGSLDKDRIAMPITHSLSVNAESLNGFTDKEFKENESDLQWLRLQRR